MEITIASERSMKNICEHGSGFIGSGASWKASGASCCSPQNFIIALDTPDWTELAFHLFAVVNLSDPFENDLVVHIKSLPDDKDVVHFVLDDDLARMDHVSLSTT